MVWLNFHGYAPPGIFIFSQTTEAARKFNFLLSFTKKKRPSNFSFYFAIRKVSITEHYSTGTFICFITFSLSSPLLHIIKKKAECCVVTGAWDEEERVFLSPLNITSFPHFPQSIDISTNLLDPFDQKIRFPKDMMKFEMIFSHNNWLTSIYLTTGSSIHTAWNFIFQPFRRSWEKVFLFKLLWIQRDIASSRDKK